MAQPAPYDRSFDFYTWQTSHPQTPLPADKINTEYDAIAAVIDEVLNRIAILQRDDLQLANRSVGYDQLKVEVEIGFEPPSTWAPGVAYSKRSTAIKDSIFYRCAVAHTSLNFATELGAGKWTLLADLTGPAGPAATVAIGTVSTVSYGTPASVTNVGTSAAAILDFEIPEGAPGDGEGGSGDMAASVYDPQEIEDDAFDRANHTGTQLAATISDFAATVASEIAADIGVTLQGYSANLAEWSGINPSSNGGSLVAAADYAAMRSLLDLEAGTDFLSPSAIAAAYQPLDSDLTALAGLSSTGIVVRTGAGTATVRSIANGTGIAVTDGSGVSGNPTVALSSGAQASLALADSAIQAAAIANMLETADIGVTLQAYDAMLDSLAALTDPNADRIAFWDDSAGAIAWLTIGTNLSISGTTLNASGGGGGGGGDMFIATYDPQGVNSDAFDVDNHTDGTANKVFTATEKTKLSGIASGATANSADATLLARANHTGTQLASTISDFSTAADARVSAAIGSSVQAYDADLTTWAGLTPSSNFQTLVPQTFSQMRASLDLEAGTDFYSISAANAAFQGLDSNLTSWAGVTRASGFDTFVATPSSANLRALLTDETGTGIAYFVGGALGTPASGTLTNATGLPVSTGISGLGTGVATFLATPSSANLRAALTDETGTGIAYFVGGALGTPASATLTNATGLPAAGVVGTAATLTVENQALTGGATVTSKSLGTITTGTLTLDVGDCPLQHYTANGAHTLAPGSVTGACMLDVVNGASSGARTLSGWTKVEGSFTNTNGHKFRCHCSVGQQGSLLIIQALQ